MTAPLEALTTAAARLVQEGNALGGGALAVRLKEISAAIRCAVASIRNESDAPAANGRYPKFVM